MNVLAISGSLRAASLNTALLRAVVRIAPSSMAIHLFGGLGNLPLFNPDIEATNPAPIIDLRAQIVAADAVIIASPEYAHGISAPIKNALDWMVGNESFVGKPVAFFNASPRATHAQAALRETLTTISARVIFDACIAVPILGSGLDEDGIVANAGIRTALLDALRALQAGITADRAVRADDADRAGHTERPGALFPITSGPNPSGED